MRTSITYSDELHELPATSPVEQLVFERLLGGLEDWYADSTRAMALDTQEGPGSREQGHAVLHRNRYPGPPWRARWRAAWRDPSARADIIHALEEELYGLDHGPSQSGPASGLHRGTAEWRAAVALADGSLRAVARRFGISHTEVRRIRASEGTHSS